MPVTAPIFIHGILPRSGTNFLWDLLRLHPDCAPAVEPVREDLFLECSEHLVAFTSAVQRAWDPRWGTFGPALPARLHAALGEGLVSFLWDDRNRRLVTKSPSVHHLDRFFEFFPEAYLVVLIRDGRAVTQSCMDTFGWTFDRAARAWARAADELIAFQKTHAGRASQWHLVRYEALLDNLDEEILAILRFSGLSTDRYDLSAARSLPVRGSSTFFGEGRSSVNWEPVSKDRSFAPKERWRAWDRSQAERFDWLAGHQLRALGYQTEPSGAPGLGKTVRLLALDMAWAIRQLAGRTRARVGAISRPLRRKLGLAP